MMPLFLWLFFSRWWTKISASTNPQEFYVKPRQNWILPILIFSTIQTLMQSGDSFIQIKVLIEWQPWWNSTSWIICILLNPKWQKLFEEKNNFFFKNWKLFILPQLVDGLFRIFFSNTTKWHVFRKVLTYRNRISIQKNPTLALPISDFFKKLKIY